MASGRRWILFRTPCPTPDGRTAQDLYDRRLTWITPDMQASSVAHGCRFHGSWFAEDGSAFHALAQRGSREGARAFFELWQIEAEPGETATVLVGDVGLVPIA